MSEIRRKIIENGTIPLMTDEGMSALIKFGLKAFESGSKDFNASREISLSSTKNAIEGVAVPVDSRKIYPIRAKIVTALLDRMRGDSYENIRRNLSREYFPAKEMSDEEIQEMLSIPNEQVENALISGNLDILPGAIVHLWESNASFAAEYNGAVERLPYETVDGNTNLLGRSSSYRIYFNQPNDINGYEFWGILMRKCIERGIPFDCKPTEHLFSTHDSRDRSVFYVKEEHIDIVLEILEEIAEEYPELVSLFGSAMSSGLNYSYYTIVDSPNGKMTYNDLINRTSRGALFCSMSEFILEDVEFVASLTPMEREALAQAADPKVYLDQIDGKRSNKGNSLMPAIVSLIPPHLELVTTLILRYAQTHNMDDDRLKMLLEERLTQFVSYTNGNEMNMPIALSGHFYEGMASDMSSAAAPRKPVVPKPERTATPAKSTSATDSRRVPVQPTRTLSKEKPMTPQERSEFLRDFDYELHDLFMDYLQASLKDPAGATEILLAKLDELKRKFIVASSLESGFKSTRKYADIMKTFAKLENFKPYQNDPTKGDMINRGLKRQYYAAMYETLRPEVKRLALSVIDVKD